MLRMKQNDCHLLLTIIVCILANQMENNPYIIFGGKMLKMFRAKFTDLCSRRFIEQLAIFVQAIVSIYPTNWMYEKPNTVSSMTKRCS